MPLVVKALLRQLILVAEMLLLRQLSE